MIILHKKTTTSSFRRGRRTLSTQMTSKLLTWINKVLLSLTFALSTSTIEALDKESYRYGLIPAYHKSVHHRVWSPVFNYFRTHAKTSIIPTDSYCELLKKADKLNFDYFVAPSHYAHYFIEKRGYRPIALIPTPATVKVFRKSSIPLTSVSTLRGQVATGPPESISYYLIKEALQTHQEVTLIPHRWIDAALMSVLSQKIGTGAVNSYVYQAANLPNHKEIQTLDLTSPLPSIIVLASPSMSSSDLRKFQELFIKVNTTETGKNLLTRLNLAPFQYPLPSELNIIREHAAPIEKIECLPSI